MSAVVTPAWLSEDQHAVVLVRHGSTDWTASGRHTGRTDVPLDSTGRRQARAAGRWIRAAGIGRTLSSPSARAVGTCRIAMPGTCPEILSDLQEWDYGAYEGLTTPEIRGRRPGWDLWTDGCPSGESPEHVGARADRVIAVLGSSRAPTAVFAHGHLLRVLAARWVGLPPATGKRLLLEPGGISGLAHERGEPVIALWNQPASRRS